jgi:hypothetical protein
MQFVVIDPIESGQWDDAAHSSTDHSVFHSSSWARVLSDTYGYHPHYMVALNDGGGTVALLPMMEVSSLVTNRRGVSLPFSDYCEPIVTDQAIFQEMVEEAKSHALIRGWKYMEFRGGQQFFETRSHFAEYRGHRLQLEADFDNVLSTFRDSTRRNITGAVKAGVKTEILTSLDAVKQYYDLHCATRKYQGLPPQPWTFFRNIHKQLISAGYGFVVLATHGKEIIAGAVFLHFDSNAVYKYGASKREYQFLKPNNLVMWSAIRWYCENGFKSFSFGRTDMQNEGLRQFKKGWGVIEYPIKYYRYDIQRGEFLTRGDGPDTPLAGLLRRMPIPVLRVVGRLAYKHMG